MAEMKRQWNPKLLELLRASQKFQPLPPLPTPDELRNGATPVWNVAEPKTTVENGVASGRYTIKPSNFIDQINQGLQIRDQFLKNIRAIRAGKKGNYTEEEIDAAHALDEADLEKAQMSGVKQGQQDIVNKTYKDAAKIFEGHTPVVDNMPDLVNSRPGYEEWGGTRDAKWHNYVSGLSDVKNQIKRAVRWEDNNGGYYEGWLYLYPDPVNKTKNTKHLNVSGLEVIGHNARPGSSEMVFGNGKSYGATNAIDYLNNIRKNGGRVEVDFTNYHPKGARL